MFSYSRRNPKFKFSVICFLTPLTLVIPIFFMRLCRYRKKTIYTRNPAAGRGFFVYLGGGEDYNWIGWLHFRLSTVLGVLMQRKKIENSRKRLDSTIFLIRLFCARVQLRLCQRVDRRRFGQRDRYAFIQAIRLDNGFYRL